GGIPLKQHLWISGKFKKTENYKAVKSPFSGEVIAEVAMAAPSDVKSAIDAADQSRKTMAEMPAHKRAEILENAVALLKEEKEECAKIISLEASKPIKAARGE